MTLLPEQEDLDRFQEEVARRFGLCFDKESKDRLRGPLTEALRRTAAASANDYVQRLKTNRLARSEIAVLARELTVAETHFFRHPDQLRALTEAVLPELMRSSPRRRLSLLSAGCASGEEPYTLTLALKESPVPADWEVTVTGIDLNPSIVARAKQGRFSNWSMRGLSVDLLQRYFTSTGKEHLLAESIRDRVSFAERNLIEDDPTFWQPDRFDVIFCRNVLMYFTPEATQAVLARFASALTAGGFLFVGPAETLRGLTHEFQLRHSHDTFYYQRVGPAAKASSPERAASPTLTFEESWMDTITQAAERIQGLGRKAPQPFASPEARLPPTPGPSSRDMNAVRELVRLERFDEALKALRAATVEQANDADAQLLEAMILTNRGDVERAEQLCRAVLAANEGNAEAHYLLALCREHRSETASALEEDETAISLAPRFAMPHLHLALLHKRLGHRDAARRYFQQASLLLPQEQTSRLLLFGGGFSREALVQLCRNELRSGGGAS